MGHEISVFNRYDQSENRTTNYCGLMLKLIYQRSPDAFQSLIASLLGDSSDFDILPSFQQQIKNEKSIPDLMLRQKSFTVLFETKTTDWHYSDQLRRHIEGISKADIEILFLLSNEYSRDINDRIEQAKRESGNETIYIINITFEDLLEAVKSAIVGMSLNENDYLYSIMSEFENYLLGEALLPKWKNRLSVVSCGNTIDEVRMGFYACPSKGGIYSYARSKYFGAYWSKAINYLAEIKALVRINDDKNYSFEMIWNNCEESDEKLFAEAEKCLQLMIPQRQQWAREGRWQIFLFGDRCEVKIKKETKGGLRGKTYWDISSEQLSDAVIELENKDW